MRTILAFGLCGALIACGNPAVQNPDYVGIKQEGSLRTGSYNPKGFTPEQLQTAILRGTCPSGSLASYAERPGQNGLIDFTATCA